MDTNLKSNQELSPTIPRDGEARTCVDCGQSFPKAVLFALGGIHYRCRACTEKHTTKAGTEQSRGLIERWKSICPATFQETDKTRLPRLAIHETVMAWEYGPTGLLLHGLTALGKSRAAWEIVKREFMAGKSFDVLNSFAGLEYASLYASKPEKIHSWLVRKANVDLLLLDDVFKVKITDSFEAAVFAIIDRRVENLRPVICTMNDSAETLSARISPDRSGPLLRRLRESCLEIAFE